METQLVVTLKVDELKSIITESVENAIKINSKAKEEDSLLCRKDLARLFSVSLVTISAWTKSGKLPYYQIGSRIYFKKNEVMQIFESRTSR
jgi:excisionase family DNA binding protein